MSIKQSPTDGEMAAAMGKTGIRASRSRWRYLPWASALPPARMPAKSSSLPYGTSGTLSGAPILSKGVIGWDPLPSRSFLLSSSNLPTKTIAHLFLFFNSSQLNSLPLPNYYLHFAPHPSSSTTFNLLETRSPVSYTRYYLQRVYLLIADSHRFK